VPFLNETTVHYITCTINWFLQFFHCLVPKIQCFKRSKCNEGITSRPMKGLFTGNVSDKHSFDPPECAPRTEYSRTSYYMNLDRTTFNHSDVYFNVFDHYNKLDSTSGFASLPMYWHHFSNFKNSTKPDTLTAALPRNCQFA
jgi:hypothetical protein